MARKSKGNFNMKGHSIPGIKGFKETSLEDGRAASSAFQMKESPLHETKLGEEVDFSDKIEEAPEWKRQRSKKPGETGVEFAMRALAELAHARKLESKKSKSDKLDEQTEKYDETVEEGNPRQNPDNYDEHGNYIPDMDPELREAYLASKETEEEEEGKSTESGTDLVAPISDITMTEERTVKPKIADLSSGATTSDWDAKSEGGHSMNDLVRMRDEARNNGDKELEKEIQASINEGYKR